LKKVRCSKQESVEGHTAITTGMVFQVSTDMGGPHKTWIHREASTICTQ
jgi:hypothetical protein